MSSQPRYEQIGRGYAATRGEDPLLKARLLAALSDSASVVNVGAGTGSYEPLDRHVIAIEPSDIMAAQRPAHLVPALRGSAAPLPLRDDSVDAAMAVLTIHHWDEQQEAGVRELRRVARGPVAIVTIDPKVCGEMWLLRDYMPEVLALDREIFPPTEQLAEWLGGHIEVEVIPTSRNSPDWNLASFWAHPERVLGAGARQATSGFARMSAAVVERVVAQVEGDLQSGEWDKRYGELRDFDALDVGMRLIVAHPV